MVREYTKDFIMRLLFLFALLAPALLPFAGSAGPEYLTPAPAAETLEAVDYVRPENWVLYPGAEAGEPGADVFYLYPTVTADRGKPLMEWNDSALRDKTRNLAREQTSLFRGTARVYAPFCRQLEFFRSMRALSGDRAMAEGFRPGVRDAEAAFDYYWKYCNRGRPFFLLGHSQGAMELFELMKSRFKDPAIREKLVAAYLIGMPLTARMLEEAPHLRFARGADDTGVIVTYNTESADAEPSPFTGPGVLCINPLNWRTDAVEAPPAENLGARFYDWKTGSVREIPAFCGARIDPARGALIAAPGPGRYDSRQLGRGVFHMNDLYFFFENLRKNISDRLAAHRAGSGG